MKLIPGDRVVLQRMRVGEGWNIPAHLSGLMVEIVALEGGTIEAKANGDVFQIPFSAVAEVKHGVGKADT